MIAGLFAGRLCHGFDLPDRSDQGPRPVLATPTGGRLVTVFVVLVIMRIDATVGLHGRRVKRYGYTYYDELEA
jgi:hypothetical protein